MEANQLKLKQVSQATATDDIPADLEEYYKLCVEALDVSHELQAKMLAQVGSLASELPALDRAAWST